MVALFFGRMQNWRTPGDALVTPIHGLVGLSAAAAAAIGTTPRPPTDSILRRSLAPTPLPRNSSAATDHQRQDVTAVDAPSTAESRAEEDEFASVLQACAEPDYLSTHKLIARTHEVHSLSASLHYHVFVLFSELLLARLRANQSIGAHKLLAPWSQDVMTDVLDPRLAVAKFEQIARKQAAKLRESAGVNFHRRGSQSGCSLTRTRTRSSATL